MRRSPRSRRSTAARRGCRDSARARCPPKVIKQRFKRQILHDVAHELIERAVGEALQERGVEPVDTPDIRDVKLEEGQPLTFKAEFDVVPSFDPGEFSSIEVRRPPVNVDDAAVDQALERLRERAARFEPVEGGAVDAGHTRGRRSRTAVVRQGRQGRRQGEARSASRSKSARRRTPRASTPSSRA